MDTEYVGKIREWVTLDNTLTEHKDAMKASCDRKRELEDDIVSYVEKRCLDKLTVNISDGNLRFSRRNITQALGARLVRNLLERYVEETEGAHLDVDDVMSFIQANAPGKSKIVMSRTVRPTTMTPDAVDSDGASSPSGT
jgi:hypothetical protein